MKNLSEFATNEKIAIEIIVYCISTSNKKLKTNQKYIQNSIAKTYYPKVGPPQDKKQQVTVPYNIVENGEIKKGRDEYGSIFDDLNYGDGFMVFKNVFKQRPKHQWLRLSYKKVMEIYQNNIMCEGMNNPTKRNYLEGEKLALKKLMIICRDYESYYKAKELPDLEVDFDSGRGKSSGNFRHRYFESQESKLDIGRVSEYDIKRGLNHFFFQYFDELFYRKGIEIKKRRIKEAKLRRGYDKKNKKKKSLLTKITKDDDLSNLSLPKILFDYFMMKLIIIKINNLQIYTRSFYSDDEELIYVTMKPLEAGLSAKAEHDGINKEVEIGSIDVLSLQPVDRKFRPMISKPYYFKELLKTERPVEITDPKLPVNSVSNERFIARYLVKVQRMSNRMLRDHLKKIIREHADTIRQLLKFATKNKKTSSLRIIDNPLLPRRKWEAMYVYCRVLKFWAGRIQGYATNPKYHVYYPLLLRLIHLKALGDTNQAFSMVQDTITAKIQNYLLEGKLVLKSIWDRIHLKPVSPYARYRADPRFLKLYKNYQVNENGERSIFTSQERVKLLFRILNDCLNLEMLINLKLMIDISPLHDVYLLYGAKKNQLLKPILEDVDMSVDLDANPLLQKEKRQDQVKLEELFDSLSDEAMPSDFIKKPLIASCAFGPRTITGLPFPDIKKYFGEKIALYFTYINFQCTQMIWISIMMLFLESIRKSRRSNNDQEGERRVLFIMGMMNIIWSTIFVELWKKRQALYALENGMSNFKEREVDRPNYNAKVVRDIGSNSMNVYVNNTLLRMAKMFVTFLAALVITILAVLMVFFLLWIKYKMKMRKVAPFWYKTIPIGLNLIQIAGFNYLFSIISKISNQFENHKYRSSYENSYIVKLTCFTLANSFTSLFIIAFIKGHSNIEYLEECIGPENVAPELKCYEELSTQVSSIFTSSLLINFAEVLMPLFILIWKKRNQRFEVREYNFGVIDRYILKESLKMDYRTSFDLDGTLGDYMTLVVEFAFLSFFGVTWPGSYFLAFISDIIQVHIDKFKLFHLMRRPIPKGASGIGTWQNMLDLISYGSICINAALIVFTSSSLTPSLKANETITEEMKSQILGEKLRAFTILMVIFYFVKSAAKSIFSKVSESYMDIKKRQELLLANIFSKDTGTVKLNLAKTGFTQRIRHSNKIMAFRCSPKKIINTDAVSENSDLRTSDIFDFPKVTFDLPKKKKKGEVPDDVKKQMYKLFVQSMTSRSHDVAPKDGKEGKRQALYTSIEAKTRRAYRIIRIKEEEAEVCDSSKGKKSSDIHTR